jgi:hypothetical protein
MAADGVASKVHNCPAQVAPMERLPHIGERSILRLGQLVPHLQMLVKALGDRLLAAQLAAHQTRHRQVVRQDLLLAGARLRRLALDFVIVVVVLLVLVVVLLPPVRRRILSAVVFLITVIEDTVRIGRHNAIIVDCCSVLVFLIAVLHIVDGDNTVGIRTIVVHVAFLLLLPSSSAVVRPLCRVCDEKGVAPEAAEALEQVPGLHGLLSFFLLLFCPLLLSKVTKLPFLK